MQLVLISQFSGAIRKSAWEIGEIEPRGGFFLALAEEAHLPLKIHSSFDLLRDVSCLIKFPMKTGPGKL